MDYQKLLLIAVISLSKVLPKSCVLGSDAELTTDYAVPAGMKVSAFDGNFFTYKGFRGGPNPALGKQASIKATVNEFPALQGLGISFVLMYFQRGGVLAPHFHPRGSKLIYIMQGSLTVGFIDSTNKLYKQTLLEGDCFVVPRAMVHYMANLNSSSMTKVIFSFSGSNPGTISLPETLFGSHIPDPVLTASFQVNGSLIHTLETPF